MVYNVIVVAIDQHRVVTSALDGHIFGILQDTALVFIRSHRAFGAGSILHTVGMVVARTRRVGEVIDTVAFEHKRCFEEVLDFGVQNELLVGKALAIFGQLGYTATKAFVNTPSTEIEVFRAIVITEKLRVEGDGIVYKAVFHQNGIGSTQTVLPWADGGIAFAYINHTRSTIIITVSAIGLLNHIGCPNHFGSGPIHGYILPIDKVFRHPYLGRAITVTGTIGGGVDVIGIAKLLDGGVGKIAGEERITGTRCIPFDRGVFFHCSSARGCRQ